VRRLGDEHARCHDRTHAGPDDGSGQRRQSDDSGWQSSQRHARAHDQRRRERTGRHRRRDGSTR